MATYMHVVLQIFQFLPERRHIKHGKHSDLCPQLFSLVGFSSVG